MTRTASFGGCMALIMIAAMAVPTWAGERYRKAVLADGPVGYWRLDEPFSSEGLVRDWADEASDPQQGAQDGTHMASSGWYSIEQYVPGLADGNWYCSFYTDFDDAVKEFNYIEAPDCEAFDITNELTLEAWIWVDDTSGASTLDSPVIAKYFGDGADDRSYLLAIDGATVEPAFFVSPDGTFGAGVNLQADGALTLDQWYHLAAVFKADDSMRIYTNGALAAELTTGVPDGIFESSADVWIGQYHAVWDRTQFNGRIDEVAVYNRALSGAEIEAHYNAGASGSPGDYPAAVLADDPVAYWRMEDMSKLVNAWAVNATGDDALNGNYIQFDASEHENAGPRSPGFAGFEDANEAPHFTTDFSSSASDSNYVAVSDSTALDITNELTLEAWVNIEGVNSSPPGDLGIVGKYVTGGDRRAYLLGLRSSTSNVFFIVSSNGEYAGSSRIDTPAPLAVGQWHHLVGVFEPGSMTIYTNGVLATNTTDGVPTEIYNSSSPLWIGMFGTVKNEYQFKGLIDEVAVYDKALSAIDIDRHYRAAFANVSGTLFLLR